MFAARYGQILEYFYDADRLNAVLWPGIALLVEDGTRWFRQRRGAIDPRF